MSLPALTDYSDTNHQETAAMALNAEPRGSNTYWKIPKYWFTDEYSDLTCTPSERKRIAVTYLEKRDIKVPPKTTLEQLANLISRFERGLLNYASYDAKTLREFAAARSLQCSRKGRLSQKAIIGVLEHADDNARFERMLELPAELRVRIYEYYCLDLGQRFALGLGIVPLEHRQPPLTLVCRLLRQESLQIFYDTCVLLVDFQASLSLFWDEIEPPCQMERNHRFLIAASVATRRFKRLHLRIGDNNRLVSLTRSTRDLLDVFVDMPKTSSGIDDVSVQASWRDPAYAKDELFITRLGQAKDVMLAVVQRVAAGDFEWCPEGLTELAGVF